MDEVLANAYIKGASDLLQGKIEGMPKIIVIPKGATNGDMIMAIFPQWNLREGIGFEYKLFGEKHKFEGLVDEDWWNAPYRIKEDDENGRAD